MVKNHSKGSSQTQWGGLTKGDAERTSPGEPSSGKARKKRQPRPISEEERSKRERLWKLKSNGNALRMKLNAGKRLPTDLVKEVLLGEHAESLDILTDDERARVCTPEILEELGPALRRTVSKAIRAGKRRKEVTVKSPSKRQKTK
jgi:hypothetical protein